MKLIVKGVPKKKRVFITFLLIGWEIRQHPLGPDFGSRSAADVRHEHPLQIDRQSPVTFSARGAIGSSEERNKWAGARPANAGREGCPFMPDPTLNRSRPALGGARSESLQDAGWGWDCEWVGVFCLERSQELILWSPGGGQRLLSETRATCFFYSV